MNEPNIKSAAAAIITEVQRIAEVRGCGFGSTGGRFQNSRLTIASVNEYIYPLRRKIDGE